MAAGDRQGSVRAALRRLLAPIARGVHWLVRGPSRRGQDGVARYRRIASIGARLLVGFLLFSIASVGAMRWIRPVTTSFILQERAFGDQPVRHGWTPLRDISPQVALAVVAAEDQRFPEHHGFDLEQIRIALNDGSGRGASTISQQVAKNLYLWPGGGWFRKGIEAGFTVLIESMWPKRRILEVYLNIAEFGPGVFGVTEASRRFFRKEPSELTRFEAARLAAVLPSPKRMSVSRPGPYVQSRTGQIVRQMDSLGASYLSGIR